MQLNSWMRNSWTFCGRKEGGRGGKGGGHYGSVEGLAAGGKVGFGGGLKGLRGLEVSLSTRILHSGTEPQQGGSGHEERGFGGGGGGGGLLDLLVGWLDLDGEASEVEDGGGVGDALLWKKGIQRRVRGRGQSLFRSGWYECRSGLR